MASISWQSPVRRGLILSLVIALSGCNSLWKNETGTDETDAELQQLLKVPELPELVRDAAISRGVQPLQVDGVGAINRLIGTGGAPDPSGFRNELLDEMKRHNVADSNGFLELKQTALVRVRATIPPGAKRGDPIDVRVLAPKESRATDLHGGWLMDTRLRQQQVLKSAVRRSDVLVVGTGAVLTRSDLSPGTDLALRLEGVVVGGGRVQETRKLNLVLRPEYRHAIAADQIAEAISKRFFFFDGTTRRGIARAVDDDTIEIDVHPRYRNDVIRLMEVVRAIRIDWQTAESQQRLADLASRLADPATAADASVQLEAIGDNAVPTLLEGLATDNPELQFYAAQALGYLDREEAIEPLEAAARNEAAFRQPALLALQGLRRPQVVEVLQRLMDEPSLETRYGAFCCLRRRVDGTRTLQRESHTTFHLYKVATAAQPTVVVAMREKPEIVLMGDLAPLQIDEFLKTPGGYILTPDRTDPSKLRIGRFRPGMEDGRITVGRSLPEVIHGLVRTGGEYGDVVAFLRYAKDNGHLVDQLAMDPRPRALRTYFRDSEGSEESSSEESDQSTPDDSESTVIADSQDPADLLR